MDSAFRSTYRWREWWSAAKTENARTALGEVVSIKGEFILHLTKIPDPMRTKMINSAKRGFTSAETGLWPDMLKFICQYGPIKRAYIGYVGKTYARVFVPDDRVSQTIGDIRALLALQGEYPDECIRRRGLRSPSPGYKVIECNPGWGQARARFYGRTDTPAPQLRSCFKEVRHLIEKELESCIEDRQELIDFLYSRQSTVTIPFYSGPNDGIDIGTKFHSGYLR